MQLKSFLLKKPIRSAEAKLQSILGTMIISWQKHLKSFDDHKLTQCLFKWHKMGPLPKYSLGSHSNGSSKTLKQSWEDEHKFTKTFEIFWSWHGVFSDDISWPLRKYLLGSHSNDSSDRDGVGITETFLPCQFSQAYLL